MNTAKDLLIFLWREIKVPLFLTAGVVSASFCFVMFVSALSRIIPVSDNDASYYKSATYIITETDGDVIEIIAERCDISYPGASAEGYYIGAGMAGATYRQTSDSVMAVRCYRKFYNYKFNSGVTYYGFAESITRR